jgi:glutamine synthetase
VTPAASLDALQADTTVAGWLRGEMLPTYLALKRWEVAAAAEAGEEASFARYRDAY